MAPALNGVVTGIGVLMMIFLLFLVVDAIQLCMGWIRKLASSEVEWTGATAEDVPRAPTVRPHHAACWLKIMLIGERTREVGRLLYAPLLVILLMLLARSSYFDGFAFPKALAIVVGLNFTIVLVAAARLNVVARDARNAILEDLRNERRELKRPEVAEAAAPTPEAIDDLIKQLDAIDLGAFQRLRNQPLARTAAVLLTAIGITWGEYGLLLN